MEQRPYLFCRRKTHPPLKTSLSITTFKNSNDIDSHQYPVILESVRKGFMIVNNSNVREREITILPRQLLLSVSLSESHIKFPISLVHIFEFI